MTISLSLAQITELFPEPALAINTETLSLEANSAWQSTFDIDVDDSYWPFKADDKTFVKNALETAINNHCPTVSLELVNAKEHANVVLFNIIELSDNKTLILKLNRRERGASKPTLHKQVSNDDFMQRVNSAIQRCNNDEKYQFAVLLIDIDQFRMVADQTNLLSDELIPSCAQSLTNNLRDKDHFAHLQNDQFCVFADNVTDPSHVLRLAERIQNSFQQGIKVENELISITASIGISLGNVGHSDAEHILHDADIAMYRAKLNGKGRYEIFDRAQYDHSVEVLELERDIRIAFEKQQFSLLYEPIVSLGDSKTVGVVPRICWSHPKFGDLRSENFLDLAENQNLVELLTNLRINNGCLQLTQWRQQFSEAAPAWINIPLRSVHSMRPELIEQLLNALQQSQLDAPDIHFCVSPNVLNSSPESTISIVNQLKALEITVGLNDFGDKHSSILDLHRCPFDFVMTANSLLDSAAGIETIKSIRLLTNRLNQKLVVTNVSKSYIELIKNIEADFATGPAFQSATDAEKLGEFLGSNMQVA